MSEKTPPAVDGFDCNSLLEERLAEENEENRLMEEFRRKAEGAEPSEEGKENQKHEEEEEDDDDAGAMPVPQVRLGPNGEIILDEQSLVNITIIIHQLSAWLAVKLIVLLNCR